jgi:hypothetical protein
MVADFARNGDEDARRLAVDYYDSIIGILKSVLERMRRLESLAGILERLREVRKTEHDIARVVKKALEAEGRAIHPPDKENNPSKRPNSPDKRDQKRDNGRELKEPKHGEVKESSPSSRENRNQNPAPVRRNQSDGRGR